MSRNSFVPDAHRLLHRHQYHSYTVEQWIAPRRISRDFGGFADILAFQPVTPHLTLAELDDFQFRGVLAVQACSESTLWDHYYKVTEGTPSPVLQDWLLAYNRFEIWGYPRRTRKSRLTPTPKGRQLNIRFLRVVFDGCFKYQETTELVYSGYRPSR